MGPLGAQLNLVASWLHGVSFAQQEGVQVANSPPLLTQPAHCCTSLTFSLPLVSGLAFWGAWAPDPPPTLSASYAAKEPATHSPPECGWLSTSQANTVHSGLRRGLQAPPGRQRGSLLNKALRG